MTLRAPGDADFQRWIRDRTLSPEQVEAIRSDLASSAPLDDALPVGPPLSKEARARGVDLLTVAYYAGVVLILGAMGWFLGSQWDALGPPGIFFTALSYAILFAILGGVLRFRRGYPVAGGLMLTCAVCMVPILVHALGKWGGLWSSSGYWDDEMETLVAGAATATVGILLLRYVRFPFLVCPVAFAVWAMAMAAAESLPRDLLPYREEAWVSVAVGGLMLAAAFMADRHFEMDLAFWGYVFGLAAFWGGLTSMDSDSEAGKALYALVNLGLLAAGVYLDRRVFLVFGTLGLLGYFYHLADKVFAHSALFPFVVAFLGLGILLGAVYLQRHAVRISASVDRYRPKRFRTGGG